MKKRIALALSLLCSVGARPALAAPPDLTLSYAQALASETTADAAVAAPAASQVDEALSQIEIRAAPEMPAAIDLTNPPDSLWERIRHGFSMTNLNNEVVLHHQSWYLNRPDLLRRLAERSSRYLHYIVEELDKRGMPMELALLPMIESSYNPMALSPARASGLWQFIPSTGRNYKLEQNAWIDERRDIVASTGAALDYLQTIYEMHGDWHLALASYNWGENAVARAVAKNAAKGLPTDYMSLTMPNETRHYVPKLQALKNILANPKLVAELNLPAVANKPYFSTIRKPADIDIKVAAKLAEMPVRDFVALNPANNRPVIKDQEQLVLPADRIDVFQANLENHDGALSAWRAYTPKPGERLEAIAARHGLSVAQLRAINGIGRKGRADAGGSLLVPTSRDALADLAALPSVPVDPPRAVKKSGKNKRGAAMLAKAGKGKKSTLASTAKARKLAVSGGKKTKLASKGKTAPMRKTLLARR